MSLSSNQDQLLISLKLVALEVGDSGRALTPVVGELSACKLLNLVWQPSTGFDAIGPSGEKFQIKSRKSWTTEEVNPIGRMGRFGKKGEYSFDKGILVELNDAFDVSRIWQCDREQIELVESKEAKGRGLHVYTFQRTATEVYPSERKKS